VGDFVGGSWVRWRFARRFRIPQLLVAALYAAIFCAASVTWVCVVCASHDHRQRCASVVCGTLAAARDA
jgi:ABC-type cobalamin transport system permease subunit